MVQDIWAFSVSPSLLTTARSASALPSLRSVSCPRDRLTVFRGISMVAGVSPRHSQPPILSIPLQRPCTQGKPRDWSLGSTWYRPATMCLVLTLLMLSISTLAFAKLGLSEVVRMSLQQTFSLNIIPFCSSPDTSDPSSQSVQTRWQHQDCRLFEMFETLKNLVAQPSAIGRRNSSGFCPLCLPHASLTVQWRSSWLAFQAEG